MSLPFVDVGERITTGQTVCIIEAMKLMNELESEVGWLKLSKILVGKCRGRLNSARTLMLS